MSPNHALLLLVILLPLVAHTIVGMPSRRDVPYPLASSLRYHLPKHLAEEAGCLSHADGPRCCPSPSYAPAWKGSLVPFVEEDDNSEAFGVQRCLRQTSCEAPGPLLKDSKPIMPWQKSRVAIAVMRDRSVSAYAQHTEAVNAAWAAKWNYSMIVVELSQDVPCERSISWERVEIARRLLANHDYLFFVDADLVIVEHEKPWLEDILREYSFADLITCKDSGFVMPDPKRGIGGASFANFGAFILRNTPWTHQFIDEWWELGETNPAYVFGDPHEQAAFGDWYGQKREQNDTTWMSHIVVLDTHAFNSLDPFHSTHKEGQPVIHTTMRLPRMRETLFARAHAGLCARDPHLYINKTFMEDIVFDDAYYMARKKPDNAEAQMIYASALQGRNKHLEALPYVEAAVRIKPNDVYYRSALGSAYEREKRYKEALKQYDLGLKGPVQLQSIARKRALLLVKMGKVDKAIEDLDDRINGDPDPFLSWFQMGTQLLKEKTNYKKAAEMLEKAVAANPKSTPATLNLGIAYQELRLFPKALDIFNKVLQMPETEETEHERAMVSQMRIYIGQNKPEEAIKTEKEHRRRYPLSQFRKYMTKLRGNAEDQLDET